MDPSPPRGSQSHPSLTNTNEGSSNELGQHRVRFAEGGPQASYKIHQPTARREGSSGATAPTSQPPAVYWDDQDNDANVEEGFTFYREGTPTPPEYEGHEKGYGAGLAAPVAEASTVGGGTIGSERGFNLGAPGQREVSLADSNEMSRTAKKRMLWAIIAVGVLILIGVGVGLGVGLTKGRSAASAEPVEGPSTSSSFPASAVWSSPTPTDPPSTTPADTENAIQTTTSSAAGARPTYNSDCPSLNDTIYHVPGSTKRFLRLCGIDFSGSGATDLAQVWTSSMADCMNSCASFDQCTACAWGYIEGDDGDKHRCYMKKDLKMGHDAAKDWCLAILQ